MVVTPGIKWVGARGAAPPLTVPRMALMSAVLNLQGPRVTSQQPKGAFQNVNRATPPCAACSAVVSSTLRRNPGSLQGTGHQRPRRPHLGPAPLFSVSPSSHASHSGPPESSGPLQLHSLVTHPHHLGQSSQSQVINTLGNPPVVQRLRLCASTARSVGSIPGWGTKIPCAGGVVKN